MQNITISKELTDKISGVQLSCIECDVDVVSLNAQLWKEIELAVINISSSLKVEEISQMPAVSASRKAYKACGKDPARYRLSAEALLRRVVNRNEIYQINNVVDLLNLVSISTGFSIGGYDAEKIEGDIAFGIGKENEPYIGIGRGELNIESMPVFRDGKGAFGTPTSDSVRTSVTLNTQRFLMVIIDYGTSSGLLYNATEMAKRLLVEFASAKDLESKIIR
ncbi:MAG: phenylalanine--tRNA ligase beta subunit-related protein [Draconibacterium sp.]